MHEYLRDDAHCVFINETPRISPIQVPSLHGNAHAPTCPWDCLNCSSSLHVLSSLFSFYTCPFFFLCSGALVQVWYLRELRTVLRFLSWKTDIEIVSWRWILHTSRKIHLRNCKWCLRYKNKLACLFICNWNKKRRKPRGKNVTLKLSRKKTVDKTLRKLLIMLFFF